MKKTWPLGLIATASLALLGCADSDPASNADPSPQAVCGNHACESGETATSCPQDCAAKPAQSCGDGTCDPLESFATCPQDCKPVCGNGICEKTGGESVQSCPADCTPLCGDNRCDPGESVQSCPRDCVAPVVCGDGTCAPGESRLACPQDCPPLCGDGTCEADENETDCPEDCGSGNTTYESVCGDGTCDPDETNCPDDCDAPQTAQPLSWDAFNQLTENTYRVRFDYEKITAPTPDASTPQERAEQRMEDFFAFPFPSALRTDAYGRPNLENYPLPDGDSILNILASIPMLKDAGALIPSLIQRVQEERAGFTPIGATYFTTNVRLDTQSPFPTPAETLAPDSCFQMINVEQGSKHYGSRVPLHVTYHANAKTYVWPQNTLVLRPVPGLGAVPGERYVVLVASCLKSNGRVVAQSNKLKHILRKTAPKEINNTLGYYVDQLQNLADEGLLPYTLKDIRAMTGFATSNAAQELDQIADHLKGKGAIVTDEDGIAIGQWRTNTRNGWNTEGFNAHIFEGTFKTQNYIEGTLPYTQPGEGEIRFDAQGKRLSEPKEERVHYSIIVPRTPMPPKGYPIAVYGHGTGGDDATHCSYYNDEGIVLINGDGKSSIYYSDPTPQATPMAMIGFDAHLQGQRGGNDISSTTDLVLMILKNPVVIRESWRQTVIDMLVLYDILERGQLVLPPPPGSTENVRFDPSYGLYMGHSQGSQEAGLLLGLTGQIQNAFLSAGGGGVMLSFVDLHPDLSDVQVVGTLLGGKSVADMLGFALGLEDGDISYDTFITNHIVQPLTDPIDPLNYTRRFIREPKPGWAPKNIVQTIGLGDQSTPQAAQFAMISSIGLPPIGTVFQHSEAMKILGYDQSFGASLQNNLTSDDGQTATGASIQFDYKGSSNPHFVIYNMESARQAYINFFHSVVVDGAPKASVSGNQSGSF